MRPFGVSLLMAGYDENGPQLYQVDPSGSYFAWKASAIGKNMVSAALVEFLLLLGGVGRGGSVKEQKYGAYNKSERLGSRRSESLWLLGEEGRF